VLESRGETERMSTLPFESKSLICTHEEDPTHIGRVAVSVTAVATAVLYIFPCQKYGGLGGNRHRIYLPNAHDDDDQ